MDHVFGRQPLEEFAGGQDLGLGGKSLSSGRLCNSGSRSAQQSLDYDEAVIGIGGLEEGGEDDATSGDAKV
jgi:hypothetical protein